MSSLITEAPLYCPIDAPLYPDSKVEVTLEKVINPFSNSTPVFIPGTNYQEEVEFIQNLTGNLIKGIATHTKDFMLVSAILNSEPYQTLRRSQQTLLNITEKIIKNGSTLSDATIKSLAEESEVAITNLKKNSGILNGTFYKIKERLSGKEHYVDKISGKFKTENDLLMSTWAKDKVLSSTRLVNVKQHQTSMQLVKKLSIKTASRVTMFAAFAVEIGPGMIGFINAKNQGDRRKSISMISDVAGENLAANLGTAAVVIILGFTSLGVVTVIAAGLAAGIAAGIYFGDDVSDIAEPILRGGLGQLPLF